MLSEASRVRGAQLVLIGLGESPLGELQIDRTWKNGGSDRGSSGIGVLV